jgi:hypothetical protein
MRNVVVLPFRDEQWRVVVGDWGWSMISTSESNQKGPQLDERKTGAGEIMVYTISI